MLVVGSRILVGVIFLTSAVAKARHPLDFMMALEAYESVRSSRYLHGIARCIVAAEFFVGISLLSAWLLPWSAIVGIVLLGAFGMVTTIALLAGRTKVNCGCMVFGRNETIGWHIFLRNAALICLVVPSLLEGVFLWSAICACVLMGASVVSAPTPSESAAANSTGLALRASANLTSRKHHSRS